MSTKPDQVQVSGAVVYAPEPLDKAAEGSLLVCCAQPLRDIVIDL